MPLAPGQISPLTHTATARDVARRARDLMAAIANTHPHLTATNTPRHTAAARNYARDDREFWQHRPYQTGDTPRQIDWRRSGRSDDLLVRQLQRHDDHGVSIWVDTGKNMTYCGPASATSKLATALIPTLATAGHLSANVTKINWIDITNPSVGIDDLATIYLNQTNHTPHPRADHFPKQQAAFIVTDGWQDLDTLTTWLTNIHARTGNTTIMLVTDPAEHSLPYSGRARFFWDNTQTDLIENIDDIRADYQQRINAQILAIQNLCHAQGITLIRHQSDHPTTASLCHAIIDGLAQSNLGAG